MNWGMRNRPKEHKVKAKDSMTLMLFFDPTKSGMTIKIPKWIRFPIMVLLLAAILGVMHTVVYIADLESQLAQEKSEVQSTSFAMTSKDLKIEEMEQTEEERYTQLQALGALTLQLKSELEALKDYKEVIDQKLGTTKKTTDSIPESDESSALYEFDTQVPQKDLSIEAYNFRTATLEDISIYDDSKPLLPVTDSFDSEVDRLLEELNAAIGQIDSETQSYELREEQVDEILPYWDAYPSVLPLDDTYVTSPYGMRRNPFGYGYEFHSGIDLKAYYEEIWATGSGEVIYAGYTNGYGYLVVIDHGYGLTTKYAHNSKILVEVGDKVERYDVIAISGSTGRSSGPHLHYEILKDNETQNPLDYIYEGDSE